MNSKGEWNCARIPRLRVHMGDKEVREAEINNMISEDLENKYVSNKSESKMRKLTEILNDNILNEKEANSKIDRKETHQTESGEGNADIVANLSTNIDKQSNDSNAAILIETEGELVRTYPSHRKKRKISDWPIVHSYEKASHENDAVQESLMIDPNMETVKLPHVGNINLQLELDTEYK